MFVLLDMLNKESFFRPYYDILPMEYPNMPIFWGEDELKYLEGSYMLTQLSERKVSAFGGSETGGGRLQMRA